MFLIRRQKKLFLILIKFQGVHATANGCNQKHLLSFSEEREKKAAIYYCNYKMKTQLYRPRT